MHVALTWPGVRVGIEWTERTLLLVLVLVGHLEEEGVEQHGDGGDDEDSEHEPESFRSPKSSRGHQRIRAQQNKLKKTTLKCAADACCAACMEEKGLGAF